MIAIVKVYQHHGSLAQLVEQRLEEPCVPGSSPGGATKENRSACWSFFFGNNKLLVQESAIIDM